MAENETKQTQGELMNKDPNRNGGGVVDERKDMRARIRNTTEEKPQEWINQTREWAYHELSDELQQSDIKRWIIKLFDKAVMEQRGTELQPEELRSVTFMIVRGDAASKIANSDILRPVIHFTDIAEYQNFEVAWKGDAGIATRGSAIEIDTPNGKVSLLMACGPLEPVEPPSGGIQVDTGKDYLEHEIIHSIDPYLHQRIGYNKAMDEALAYYDSMIANPKKVSVTIPNWGLYENTLQEHFEKWSGVTAVFTLT